MSGEINGTFVVLENSLGEIVGQMEMTMTRNGTPIDISNKSAIDNVKLMDGQLSGKQVQMSGTLVYNDNAQFRKVRADAKTGAQDTYTVTYASDATTDESFSCKMVPTGLSDSLPHGDKVSTTLTFLSSEVITDIAAV